MNSKIIYDQPFDHKEYGSERNRIPAVYTLNDGSVIAGADIRYNHGSDSPNNIDIAVAISKDGYNDWDYIMVNHFDDYADTVTATDSASFIDSVIVQSGTGRIFMLADAQPSECGYLQCKTGTGYCNINGKKHLLLTKGNNGDKLDTFGYYVGDYDGKHDSSHCRDYYCRIFLFCWSMATRRNSRNLCCISDSLFLCVKT